MKSRVIDFFLAMSLCGFWGCASSKPIDTAARGTQSAVDQDREQKPAQSPATVHKPAKTPANPPKAKPSNDVEVQPETVAKNGIPEIAAENETTVGKPTDMKVANALDR